MRFEIVVNLFLVFNEIRTRILSPFLPSYDGESIKRERERGIKLVISEKGVGRK